MSKVAVINLKECIRGCSRRCIHQYHCPRMAIFYDPKGARIKADECNGCGWCARACNGKNIMIVDRDEVDKIKWPKKSDGSYYEEPETYVTCDEDNEYEYVTSTYRVKDGVRTLVKQEKESRF